MFYRLCIISKYKTVVELCSFLTLLYIELCRNVFFVRLVPFVLHLFVKFIQIVIYGTHCCMNAIAWICQNLLIDSTLDEHLGSFQFGILWMKLTGTLSTGSLGHEHAFLWTCIEDRVIGLFLFGKRIHLQWRGRTRWGTPHRTQRGIRQTDSISEQEGQREADLRVGRVTAVWLIGCWVKHLTGKWGGGQSDANEGTALSLGGAGDGHQGSGLTLFGDFSVVYPWLSKHQWSFRIRN